MPEVELEEYKRNISVYRNYRTRLSKLTEESTSLEGQGRKYKNSPLVWILSLISIGVFGILTFFLIYLLFGTNGIGTAGLSFYAALLCTAIFSDKNDLIFNVASFGKFNKLKKEHTEVKNEIKKTEDLVKTVREKLRPFEEKTCTHYQNQLGEFFRENLYKKRSGGQQFEESLSEFSSMVEGVSAIDSTFVTTHMSSLLFDYKSYLTKRNSDHNIQTTKNTERITSIRNFVRNISEPQKQVTRTSPEKFYRTARNINWEEVNKKRKLTGMKGEEMAVAIEQDFFESIGRKDLGDRVRHVSAQDGDGAGYDVLSFFEDGREKYIEVKSTTSSLISPIYLSRNELAFLKEHPEDAFIYRIFVSDEDPQMRSQSVSDFLETNELIPTQYLARAK
jgi:hypothetical protein